MRDLKVYSVGFVIVMFIYGIIDLISGHGLRLFDNLILSLAVIVVSAIEDLTIKIKSTRIRILADLIIISSIFGSCLVYLDSINHKGCNTIEMMHNTLIVTLFVVGCNLLKGKYKESKQKEN